MDDLTNIGMGALPSPKDYRDIALSVAVEPVVTPLSFFVDISKLPVWNQRKIGACVGHATGKYKQKLDELDDGTIYKHSARFIYGVCKCIDGFAGEGTYPRTSMKVVYDYGVPSEDILPNDTTLDHETYVMSRKLENFVPYMAHAEKYKIASYATVDVSTLDGFKQGIIAGNGMSTLVLVGPEWYTGIDGVITWDSNRILPIRAPKSVISGHQVYVYGYEDAQNNGAEDTKIFFLNSWSENWADGGKGWFWWSEYKSFIKEAFTAVDIPQKLLDDAHNLPPPDAFKYEFKNVLTYGMESAEVKALQKALQLDGVFPATQSITGFYGGITANSVLAFQKKYNVASLAELLLLRGRRVGPKTLAKLNELFNK